MKQQLYLVFCAFIMFALMGTVKIENNELTEQIESHEDYTIQLLEEFLALDSLYQSQSQINLILRNHISDSEERRLRKDSVYMYLTIKTMQNDSKPKNKQSRL